VSLKLYPAVRKIWLYLFAGLMWSGVGIMLISLTFRWLKLVAFPRSLLFILPGIVLAAAIFQFGFSGYALKNVRRIDAYLQEKVCLFAFQKWTSYPLILFMVALGLYLRIYSPIPKPLLAVLYIGIGGSLFLASLHYYLRSYRMLPEELKKSPQRHPEKDLEG
jgi:hypothetical protein